MYWPNLHVLMLGTPPINLREAKNWRRQNVIDYPHIVTHYMHFKHTMFRREILEKGLNVKELWSRYEWKHRGSPHVHGFLVLQIWIQ